MSIQHLKTTLNQEQHTWLITGVAGFIGSNLLEDLLSLNQKVVGLDNFSSGYKSNLEQVKTAVTDKWKNFQFIEGDICSSVDCGNAVRGVDFVLHHAAQGSVPVSLSHPKLTHHSNVTGCLNLLIASKDANVKRFVYASSSAVYGEQKKLPIQEDNPLNQLSPYGVSKYMNELYANIFSDCYGLETIGLRYFNVFGKRQDPNGSYAAVIPKWISALLRDENPNIFGDGTSTRDFCYVENVVQANLLAAFAPIKQHEVFNVATQQKISLTELLGILQEVLLEKRLLNTTKKAVFDKFRAGDIKHSYANTDKIQQQLGYKPEYDLLRGLQESIKWYANPA